MSKDSDSSVSRHLHITIHEGSGTGVPGRGDRRFVGGSDPKPTAVSLPPPSDPAKTAVSLPPPSDPDGVNTRLANCSPEMPWAAVQATVQDCPPVSHCCCDGERGRTRASAAEREDWSGFVIVRLTAGIRSLTAESLWQLAHELHLPGLTSVLQLGFAEQPWGPGPHEGPPQGEPFPPNVLYSRPLINTRDCLSREQIIKDIDAAEKKASQTNLAPLNSLVSYWRVDARRHGDLMPDLVARFQELSVVDLAYAEITATDPSFDSDQEYFERGPLGFGVRAAWERLDAKASTVQVCDLEQGWHLNHRDFKDSNGDPLLSKPLIGTNLNDDDKSQGSHGTAVIGELGGIGTLPSNQDDKSIAGAASAFGKFLLASHYLGENLSDPLSGTNGHVTSAIAYAAVVDEPPLTAGDILLIEVQRGGKPTEIADPADRDAIRLASALGVIVVEAAGNGGVDLDRYLNPHSGRSLNPRDPSFIDSGAILVGAAAAELPHDRKDFSCFGARVDCYAWGDRVTTCGYGDLYGEDETDFYTDTFSGTSSASPMIAGAAALIQTFSGLTGDKLLPLRMREVLSDPRTGTPQGPNVPGAIGIMPDLGEILPRRLQVTEDVYLRRTPEDDGSQKVAAGELSSSPDIVMTVGPDADAANRLGEGPAAWDPAPGEPINTQRFLDPLSKLRLYLRARNRGSAEGFARALIFTSPAATFIAPGQWKQTAEIGITKIPAGDTLHTSDGILRTDLKGLPIDDQEDDQEKLKLDPPASFLAVYQTSREAFDSKLPWPDQPLPPGPPYFRFREYLDFLRGPGVAWRNVYPVAVDSTATAPTVTLSFLFAGTPDRSRTFDFLVEQRLPAGAKLTLDVTSKALRSKLVRNRPDLPKSDPLVLSQRRTELPGVRISPDAFGEATFTIKGALRTGHSLSIRQIWRGIEVGRISWWFVEGSTAVNMTL